MSNKAEFEKWYEEQVAKGMTRFHASIPSLADLTDEMREKIRADILEAEKALADGRVRNPPQPSPVDEGITTIMQSSRIDHGAVISTD